jgi:histidinol-phosphate aminotransferase
VQTYSKSHSLAGARIGLVLSNEEVIIDINKMKFSFNPYNLDRLAMMAGIAAIKDVTYFRKCCEKVIATREWFTDELKRLGFEVLPSKANFVFVRNDKISGKKYFSKLRERAILVRHFDKDPIADYVRITIGLDDDMKKLIEVTEEILCEKAK